MAGLSLRVLGPLCLAVDGTDQTLGSPMARRTLAALACRANTALPVDELVEALWPDPPASARENVRQYVSQLRKVIGDDRLVRDDRGYRLIVDDTELDVLRFATLTAEAGAADPAEAETLLADALALWRGEAFEELGGAELVAPVVARLAEARLLAAEQRADASLAIGRYEELVADLAPLVDKHPLRERLRSLLMRALQGCGRTAEALEVYEKGSRLLRGELGLEPGPALKRLAGEIGRPGQGPAPNPAPAPGPAELPADVPAFTGRAEAVVRLRGALEGGGLGAVSAIAGTGGIGKSALAIHVGHLVAEQFPDGQLYVNLHGSTPNVKPIEPAQALRQMLRSLGAEDASIPPDVDEAAGRFRSVTSGQRLLIVLDNARDTAQVRPLLPASPSCGVVLTSRRPLNLDSTHHERLDVLSEREAAGLLSRLIGAGRMDAAAAQDVAAECGCLPLAICIAAARFNARPVWDLRTLADRLGRENRRLGELEADDRGVRASFLVSYRELDTEHQRMFRMISLLDTADIALAVAAALAGVDDDRAEDLLDTLADVQLIEAHAPGRYRMHDLLRLVARGRADEEDTPEERAKAVQRGLDCYLATAHAASQQVRSRAWRRDRVYESREPTHPGIPLDGRDDVYAWLGAEVGNLHAIAQQALRRPVDDPVYVIALAAELNAPLDYKGGKKDQLTLGRLALEAADRTGDPLHQAIAHHMLGDGHKAVGDPVEGLSHAKLSWMAYQRAGDAKGEANRLGAWADALSTVGRFDDAICRYKQGIELYRRLESPFGMSNLLSNLGLTYVRAGRLADAIAAHRKSLQIAREMAHPFREAYALCNLAEALRASGDPREGISTYRQAQEASRRAGDTEAYIYGEIWWGLAWCHQELGELEQARECWRQAAAILHKLGLISDGERQDIETSDVPRTPEIIRRNQ